MSDELKPCPFCGGEAKTFGPYGWYRQYGISHSCPTFYNGSSEMAQGFNSEKAAITAWNTRADTDALTAAQEENERLVHDIERLSASLSAEVTENEKLREALERIVQWSQAYPISVFPEPDFMKAAKVLGEADMTLGAISASNMRHVVSGVGGIARAALNETPNRRNDND